jgi:hypothetical protein
MDAFPTDTAAPAAPIAATAPVAAAPVVAAAPQVAPQMPQNSGGSGIMDVLKNLNWLEVGFGILGTAALYYTIYYYKYNITLSNTFRNEMQNKLDEVTIKMQDISSVLDSKNNTASQQPQVFI